MDGRVNTAIAKCRVPLALNLYRYVLGDPEHGRYARVVLYTEGFGVNSAMLMRVNDE